MPQYQKRDQGWRTIIVALAIYFAASLIYLAPTLPSMGSGIPGGAVAATDGWQHTWHLWWVAHALAQGLNPLQMSLLYYPTGVNLAIHPLNLTTGLLATPITLLAGPVVAFNIALLSGFTLTGLGGFLLSRRVGADPVPALIAGLLLTFTPFHVTKAYDGQLELVSLQWMVLYVWLLLIAAEEPGWLAPLLAGVMLGIVGYTSLYYLLYSALYSLLCALLWLPWSSRRERMSATPPGERIGAYLLRMLSIPVVALLVLVPLLLNLPAALAPYTLTDTPQLLTVRSANLLDFWLPSYLHPLWGDLVARIGSILHPGISAWNHALGYSTLLLATLRSVMAWGQSWRWVVIAITGILLALGPTLFVGTINTGIALPYRLLLMLPGMELAQRPGHLVVLTVIALTPLAALSLNWLMARFGLHALLLTVAVAAIELAPPRWPIQPFSVDPIYTELAAHPGAILVLPNEIDSSAVLRDQMVHGRPLVGGYLARIPNYPFAELTPGVRQLWWIRDDRGNLADPAGTTAAQTMAAYGIAHIVVRWDRLSTDQRSHLERILKQILPGVTPITTSNRLSVYRLPERDGRPFIFFGRGWYSEEQDAQRSWRWMQADGELLLMNPNPHTIPVQIQLDASSYQRPREATMSLNGIPIGTWKLEAARLTTRRFSLMLPPGESRLILSAPTESGPDGRGPISLEIHRVVISHAATLSRWEV